MTTIAQTALLGIVPQPPSDEEWERLGGAFAEASTVAEIAGALLGRHGDRFGALRDLEISYLWKREGGKAGGKPTLGACVKTSGLALYFGRADFVIWLAADHCQAAGLSAWQYEALVYHQLAHAGVDKKGKPTLYPHDFEGFRAELDQYGAWSQDLELMARYTQPALFEARLAGDQITDIVREVVDGVNAGALGPDVTAWSGGPWARPVAGPRAQREG